jgi:glucoamylase
VWDLPPQSADRYLQRKVGSALTLWRFNHRCRVLRAGTTLRVEVRAAATVRWTDDDWRTVHDTETHDPGFGLHVATLADDRLAAGRRIEFTFHWTEADRWEGINFAVEVAKSA